MNPAILVLGAGTGLGLCLILAGALPRPVPLRAALAATDTTPDLNPPTADAGPRGGWLQRLGRPGVRLLRAAGLPTARTRRDLAALDRPDATHLAEQAGAALVGLLLPLPIAGLLAAAGLRIGLAAPAAAALFLAALGFAVPTLRLNADAQRLRADAQHAVAAFLGLVVVSISGGAGVDQALHDAAALGTGPIFRDIRYALDHAHLARIPAWDTLAALGTRLGVEPLEQLAATVGLAGTEGAKVRDSLRARAQALRERQLATVEADASAATERLSLPVVMLFTGYLVFLGYPAVTAVTTGL